jgi:mitogen-activated protein kinase 7
LEICFQMRTPKVGFNNVAVDLIEKLLQFDPEHRLSAEQALQHPYLEAYRDPAEEPLHPVPFDFSFEAIDSIDEMKRLIAQEVLQYRSKQFHSNKSGLLKVRPTEGGYTLQEQVIDAPMDVDEELRMLGH